MRLYCFFPKERDRTHVTFLDSSPNPSAIEAHRGVFDTRRIRFRTGVEASLAGGWATCGSHGMSHLSAAPCDVKRETFVGSQIYGTVCPLVAAVPGSG